MATRDLVIGTAGHIDHGKTALVRALTGVDTDRLPAEKQRGITIDLGFAPLDLGDRRMALVDVPGHERFIRNMVAGATGLDLAVLVVAADDSVMPQTREHLEILKLLGIPAGVVALTKCDLADPSWLTLVEDEVRSLVAGTFLETAAVVRTSATTGLGLDDLRSALRRLGDSAPGRDDPGLFRMAIDRAFTVPGHGTVVTGTVTSGSASVGDELTWHPEGRPVRVRGIHRHDRPVDRAGRGARAAINLGGVHHAEVRRGQEIATPGYLAAGRVLSVEVRPGSVAPRPLRHRGRYRLHLGTAEVAAILVLFERDEVGPGESAFGQVLLGEAVTSVWGQPFVLREESPPATLGGGRVVRPAARRVRRRDRMSIARVKRLGSADSATRVSACLAGYGLRPWTGADLVRDAGMPSGDVDRAVDALLAEGALVELPVGPRRMTRVPAEYAAELEDRVVRALGRLHATKPRHSAVPRAHVSAQFPDLDNDALVSGLLDRLAHKGAITVGPRSVALRDHEPTLSQAERRLKAELAAAIQGGGFSPPDVADLTAAAGAGAKGRAAVVADLLALLRDEHQVVEINPQLYLDFEAATELRRLVVERLSGGEGVTMSDLRVLLNTTRKYAVPIGEYLDRTGLTVRDGDVRRLGTPAADPAAAPGSAL